MWLALGLVLPFYLLFNGYELFFAPRERDVRDLVPPQFKLEKTLHFATNCGVLAGFVAEFEVPEEPLIAQSEFDRTRQKLLEIEPFRGLRLEASSLRLNRGEYLVHRSWQEAADSLNGLRNLDPSDVLIMAAECTQYSGVEHGDDPKAKNRILNGTGPVALIGVGGTEFVVALYGERRLFVFGRNI